MTDVGVLGRTFAKGAMTTVGGQLARAALQAAGLIVVARLVAPADYGTVAMALVVIGLAEILRDFGMSTAAIQAPSLSDSQRSALFWFQTSIGGVFAALVWLCAPLLATFFDHPAVTPVARWMALLLVLNGAAAPLRALALRELRFAFVAGTELAAVAVSLLLSVSLAVSGAGVWSLVVQQVSFASVVLTCVWRFRPRPLLAFADITPLAVSGAHLMGAQLLGHLARNADSLLVGRLFGPAALGLYDRAYQLLLLPLNQLNLPLSRVALPVLSRLTDDRPAFLAFALRGQRLLTHGVCGLLTLAVVLADPCLVLVLGPQWQPAVPLFQLLAVGGIFQTAAYICDWSFTATGHAPAYLRYCLVTRPLLIAAMATGALWGVTGVAAGFAIAAAATWPVALSWLRRATGLPILPLVEQASVALLVWFVSGTAGWYLTSTIHPALGAAPVLLAAAFLWRSTLLGALRSTRRP